MAHRHAERRLALACSLGLFALLVACEPNVVVGSWTCPQPTGDGGESSIGTPVPSPWSTSFEDDFCSYTRVGGTCYEDNGAYEAVSSPVRTGETAAAFTAKMGGGHSRCIVRGELPEDAYYGAWYFIPAAPAKLDNWNLFHFQGKSTASADLEGLWDVTITPAPDGSLRLSVLDFIRDVWHQPEGVPPVPLGSWFHVQVHLRRAADATGAFALYQDGVRAISLEDVITDNTIAGEWYVGNFLYSLEGPDSVVYVDDVTIRPEL